MILDSLENSKRIECIHPLFKQAFDYVKSTDFSKMEDGKYDIADAGFTVSIASLFGKEKSEGPSRPTRNLSISNSPYWA